MRLPTIQGFHVEQVDSVTRFTNESTFTLEIWQKAIKPKRRNTLLFTIKPNSQLLIDYSKLEVDLTMIFFKLEKGRNDNGNV